VASARAFVDGPFGVANADDLYGAPAFAALADRLRDGPAGEHALVGYRLANTVITDDPVTRGLCETTDDGFLKHVAEHRVRRLSDGSFEASPVAGPSAGILKHLSGQEFVSMNLWGFAETMLDELDDGLDNFDPSTAPHDESKPPELLLPGVVGQAVEQGRARVALVPSTSSCIGITHADDQPLVASLIAKATAG
jgi:hypothetical protein